MSITNPFPPSTHKFNSLWLCFALLRAISMRSMLTFFSVDSSIFPTYFEFGYCRPFRYILYIFVGLSNLNRLFVGKTEHFWMLPIGSFESCKMHSNEKKIPHFRDKLLFEHDSFVGVCVCVFFSTHGHCYHFTKGLQLFLSLDSCLHNWTNKKSTYKQKWLINTTGKMSHKKNRLQQHKNNPIHNQNTRKKRFKLR